MSHRRRFDQLRQPPPVILPSLLLCDFGNLESEVHAVERAGARALHLDVMDGNFVPNITYGMPIVQAVRNVTELPLDVHLMIARPGDYVDQFIDAGADIVTIHAEAVDDPRPILERIRRRGGAAGLAINPPTPWESIAEVLPYCDMVLAMSVMPGFGAQEFDVLTLHKLCELRRAGGPELMLEVDGGVNESTARACGAAGANMLVVGSAIFSNPQSTHAETIGDLTNLAETGRTRGDE